MDDRQPIPADVGDTVEAKPLEKVIAGGTAGADAVIEVPEGLEEKKDDDKKTKQEPKANLGNFFRVLSFASPLDWMLTALGFVCAIGAGVTMPLMQIVFGNLVGAFNGYFIPGSGTTKDAFLATVNQNALYIVYLFIAKFVLAYGSMFAFRMISVRVSATLRLAYFDALLAQPISELDKYPPGEATNSITTSTNTIQIGISDKLALLVQSTALVIAAYAIAFKYSWQLTLVSSSSMLFILVVFSVIVPPFIRKCRVCEKIEGEASGIASEVLGAIRTVLALGAGGQLRSRYARLLEDARKSALKASPLVAGQFAPAFFAIYCDFALTFWFGLKLYREGTIEGINAVIM